MAENYEQPTFDKFEVFDIINFVKKINFLKLSDIMISVNQQLQKLCGLHQKVILIKWYTKRNYEFYFYFLI